MQILGKQLNSLSQACQGQRPAGPSHPRHLSGTIAHPLASQGAPTGLSLSFPNYGGMPPASPRRGFTASEVFPSIIWGDAASLICPAHVGRLGLPKAGGAETSLTSLTPGLETRTFFLVKLGFLWGCRAVGSREDRVLAAAGALQHDFFGMGAWFHLRCGVQLPSWRGG